MAEPELTAEPEAPAEEEISLETPPAADSGHAEAAESLDFLQIAGSSPGLTELPDSVEEPAVSGGSGGVTIDRPADASGRVPGMHPLAALFSELWAARGEGSRVEVHLESGSVLLPDGYMKPHSQQDYAVLVTRDPDGCSTITVVPWKSIARIILRAVRQLPGEVVRGSTGREIGRISVPISRSRK